MKFILLFIFICSANFAFSQTTYYWVGGSTASWASSTSWNTTLGGGGSARTSPASNDILVFDETDISSSVGIQTGDIIVTSLPAAQTIGQFIIQNPSGTFDINLQSSAPSTISISGGSGTDLIVNSNTSLTISQATNAIVISLGAGTTGSISGAINVSNAAHRLTSTDASGITFNSGGSCTQGTAFSGGAFGTSGTANGVIFASGSTFIHFAGQNPFQLTQPSSLVVFQTGSLYKITGNAVGPSVNGRIYADLEFAGSGNSSMTGSTAPCIIDNLTITSGGTININMQDGLLIKGNLTRNGANVSFGSASSNNVVFSGTSKTISGALTFTGTTNLVCGDGATTTLSNSYSGMGSVNIFGSLDLGTQTIGTSGTTTFTTNQANSVIQTGTLSTSSFTVSSVSNTTGILPGMSVTGTGIPAGTYVLFVTANTVVLNQVPTSNGANSLTFSSASPTIITSNTGGLLTAMSATDASEFYGVGTSFVFNAATTTPFTVTPGSFNSVKDMTINAAVTLNKAVTITGFLNLNSGLLTNGAFLTMNNASKINRNSSSSSLNSAPTFGASGTDRVDVNIGATMTAGNELQGTTGKVGTLTTGAFTYTLAAASQVDNLILTSGGILADGGFTLTVLGNITGTGSHTGTGKISMTGSGKTISGASLTNLEFNNAGGFSLTGNTVTSGTLTLTAGALTVGSNTLTIQKALAGTIANLTTSASSSITVSGSGSGISLPSSVSALTNLTVSNTNGLTTGGNMTIAGTANITGLLILGSNNMTQSGTATLSGNGTLRLSGSLATQIGTYSSNTFTGTYEFNGSSQTIPSGTYTSLTLNGTTPALSGNVTVTNLTLTSGILDVGSNILTIASGGSISGGSGTSYIKTSSTSGGLKYASMITGTNVTFPIGNSSYNPAILNYTGSVRDWTVFVEDAIVDGIISPNNPTAKVNREWDFTPSSPVGINASITLQWNTGDQDAGFSNSNPGYVAHYQGGAGNGWYPQSNNTSISQGTEGVSSHKITSSGLTSFSPYAVANDGPLPVELASFVSSVNARNVNLNWSTNSEINNSRFDVERTVVGTNGTTAWSKVGNVTGNGTSTVSHSYAYTDRNVTSGTYSYRLKQIDNNGNNKYFNLSNEVIIDVPTKFDLSQNYPNPFNPTTKINYDLPVDAKVSIVLYDMTGREVANLVDAVQTAGYHTVSFNASAMASGLYFYRINATGGSQNFVKTMKMLLIK